MNTRSLFLAMLSVCAPSTFGAAINVDLGSADPFVVLGGSTVTNTGATNLHGGLGLWPGTSITGFPPGILSAGTVHASDAVAALALHDLSLAYTFAASQPCGTALTGQNLGGLTLTPGVYCFASSAQLTGTLTLDALGDPNAVFLFQMGSTLTTASNSSVVFANDLLIDSVYWQVGSSATLGTTTEFSGNILANTSITLNTGASIQCGRALASGGAVTLDTNDVSALGCGAPVIVVPPIDPPPPPPVDPPAGPDPPPIIPPTGPIDPPIVPPPDPVLPPGTGPDAAAVPEPATVTLLGMGLFFGVILYRRQLRKQATAS